MWVFGLHLLDNFEPIIFMRSEHTNMQSISLEVKLQSQGLNCFVSIPTFLRNEISKDESITKQVLKISWTQLDGKFEQRTAYLGWSWSTNVNISSFSSHTF